MKALRTMRYAIYHTQMLTQITFRDIEHSDAVEEKIRQKADKLHQHFPKLASCHVVIELPHHHHHKGRLYAVKAHLKVPGAEFTTSTSSSKNHAYEDVYVAIRDVFEASRRVLEEHSAKSSDH